MTDRSTICLGVTLGAAFAPSRIAHGPIRPADHIEALRADAEQLDRLFMAAPRHQWPAVAQAAMSMMDANNEDKTA